MRFLTSRKTKVIALIGTSVVASFFMLPLLQADESTSEGYLKTIAENTTGILKAVENLPTALDQLTQLAISWLQTQLPTPDSVAEMQTNFSKISALELENFNYQQSLQPSLVTELFAGVTPANKQDANDMVYQTLLGMPLFEQDPRNQNNQNQAAVDPKLNYIKKATGMGMFHLVPFQMNGDGNDVLRYQGYYETVMAAESFNAYLLSAMYEDFRVQDDPNNGDPSQRIKSLTSLQNQLLSQATAATWFDQVSKQELGLVLRQLLLFQSQVYVLLTQLVQTEKQMLYAQAINNSLVIANGVNDEKSLYDRAKTKPKTSP